MRHLQNIAKDVTTTWNNTQISVSVILLALDTKSTIKGKPLILCLPGNIVSKVF